MLLIDRAVVEVNHVALLPCFSGKNDGDQDILGAHSLFDDEGESLNPVCSDPIGHTIAVAASLIVGTNKAVWPFV
ncbi:MAG: hypothetical protein R3C03_09310 [Pirellulaceae bacterium]